MAFGSPGPLERKKPTVFFFKIFSILDYDARSRYTDLVLLVIIIETFQNKLILSPIIIYVWVLTNLGKFLYKAFKTYNL